MTRDLAVITGGSRGVGAATARELARRGWNVLLTFRAEEAAAATVVGDCRDLGAWAGAVRVDVSSEEDVRGLFADVPGEAGALRALVNNAGIVAPTGPLADLDGERMRRVLEVNVLGVLLCSREAVRRMATDRGGVGGSIVNVSSRAAVLGSPGEYVDYAASKAAVDTITTGLAREVADRGIRVNSVRLGLIDTEIHDRNGQAGRVERMAPGIPLGRAGAPEEVARAIAWLLGEESSYTTGTHLDVAGGR
ncbi:SDR family oxidoreductase [Nocardioides sp. R-C-SC26]|uniref:SDR family oxidoreductase n=1 Tax=Nocardioides sp. R-C-SC26 TaxID=2870414 RepID=UPI001E2883D6|nr:SDR family oxidoreductase [Nocardioides sp. R-C-SC26]